MISARFITTMGHLIALLMLFSTIENNIILGLPDDYSPDEKHQATEVSWVCYWLDFVPYFETLIGCFNFWVCLFSIWFWRNIFWNFVISSCGKLLVSTFLSFLPLQGNMFQIFFHFIGSIFLCWLITENWSYKALWPIVISCNLPTALYEVGILLSIFVFRIIVYWEVAIVSLVSICINCFIVDFRLHFVILIQLPYDADTDQHTYVRQYLDNIHQKIVQPHIQGTTHDTSH